MGRILLPHLLRRVAALIALSVLGIALLAPLSARSALPDPVARADRLLAGTAGSAVISRTDAALARSVLSVRDASGTTHGAEPLAGQPLPTPASAPMEATSRGRAENVRPRVASMMTSRLVVLPSSTKHATPHRRIDSATAAA